METGLEKERIFKTEEGDKPFFKLSCLPMPRRHEMLAVFQDKGPLTDCETLMGIIGDLKHAQGKSI